MKNYNPAYFPILLSSIAVEKHSLKIFNPILNFNQKIFI